MKSQIKFTIIAFLLSLTSFAQVPQDSTVVQKVKQLDTNSNFKQVYSDVKAGLVGLSAALKVGTEHVYEILVKQQVIMAISYLITLLFSGFVIIYGFKKVIDNWTDITDLNLECIVVLPSSFAVLWFFAFFNLIDDIITGFLNPEFGAIQEIINFVK